MKMFVVDSFVEYSSVLSVEVADGKCRALKNATGSLKERSNQLLQLILMHRPEKLVFDEHGFGLGVKDQMIGLLSGANINIKENGTLTY